MINANHFTPDIRWDIISNASTFEEFEANYLFKTRLLNSVDKKILDYANIIQRLLNYSYYEYEFITVALRITMTMFEVSIKHYYFVFEKKPVKGVLASLIKELESSVLKEKESMLTTYRHIRNMLTHTDMYDVLPPSIVKLIEQIFISINGLETLKIEKGY